jgi:hypothetical protein
VISAATYQTLCRMFSARGLRKSEKLPGDPDRPPDRARRFELLVRQAAAEGLITPSRLTELLGQSPAPSRPRISSEELASSALIVGDEDSLTPEDREWLDFPDDHMVDE